MNGYADVLSQVLPAWQDGQETEVEDTVKMVVVVPVERVLVASSEVVVVVSTSVVVEDVTDAVSVARVETAAVREVVEIDVVVVLATMQA